MYMAAYFRANTNIDPVLIAPHGSDFRKYAKGLNLLPATRGKTTLLYKNVTHGSIRTQSCGNLDAAEPVPITSQLRSRMADADIIVLAPLLPNYTVEYIKELLAVKKPGCLTVLLPQGFLRSIDASGQVSPRKFKEVDDVLPLFDLAILSDEDVHGDFCELQRWAKQSLSTNIIMTQGAQGASWVKPTGLASVGTEPIPKEHVIDSVGSGDTFSAAAVVSYFTTKDVVGAIKVGNEAAGAKIRRRNQTPTFVQPAPQS